MIDEGIERTSFERNLIAGLESPPADVAEMCARSLGRRNGRAAVPALCDTVVNRTDLDAVRVAAIHAMGAIGDLTALPTLRSAACQGHMVVRLAAIEALARFPLDRSIVEILEEIVNIESSSRLRAAAEQVLREGRNNRDTEENDVD